MKNMRRIASFVLALVMVFSLAISASAADSTTSKTGSITVENVAAGTEYKLYKIFDLESFSDSDTNDQSDITGAYSYRVNSAWANFINQETIKGVYVEVDANGYVTWKSGASAASFAAAAIEYAEENNIAAVATHTISDTEAATGSYKFENLELGYYLIDSSLGALCALDTTNPDATVTEKNAGHSLDKDVKEGENWGNKNDADIGDTVEFKATINISGVAKDLVVHDTMDDGLTYDKVTSVTKNGETVSAEGNYTVTPNATHTVGDTTVTHTFDVVFSEAFCNSLKTGDVIVVYYQATLNENAVVKEAEVNKAHLEYKDNSGETHETTDSETETFTWEIDVLKYANGNVTKVLAGAKFKLTTDADGKNVIKFNEIKAEGKTTIYEVATDGTVSEITTDATGKFEIHGLDSGEYYLIETEAPVGYNKLNTVVQIKVDSEGKVYVGTTADGVTTYGEATTEVQVNNNAGTELPSTGGMGTTLFYVFGGIMVLAAVVLLVTKKRMSAAE